MSRLTTLALISGALVATAAIADDAAKLVGTWKLVSSVNEFQDGSSSRPVFGANPRGFLVYTPDGRQMVLIEAEGRKPAKSDEERAALFASMLAWTGTYRLEGDKHVLKIDGAWNPALVGSERIATVRIEGDRLHSIAPWAPHPVLPGSPVSRGVTVWERVR